MAVFGFSGSSVFDKIGQKILEKVQAPQELIRRDLQNSQSLFIVEIEN